MKNVIRQRARLARVRRIQHGLAATAAAQAKGEVRMLEDNVDRLARLRGGLGVGEGVTSGAYLSSLGELAMRLDKAREGLDRTIKGARAAADARETVRLAARRDQESAERLEQRAVSAAERLAERRAATPRRPRYRMTEQGEQQ